MKKAKIILSTAVILVLSCSNMLSYAQCGGMKKTSRSNKTITSSYGGTVRKADNYSIEMVFNPLMTKDPIVFYLTDKKGRPLNNQAITGNAEFTYSDGTTESVILDKRGENGFAGQIKNRNQSFISLLTLKIKDKNVTAHFDGGPTEKGNSNSTSSAYTCPMHPEVKSEKPGKCPKCGMSLEKVE